MYVCVWLCKTTRKLNKSTRNIFKGRRKEEERKGGRKEECKKNGREKTQFIINKILNIVEKLLTVIVSLTCNFLILNFNFKCILIFFLIYYMNYIAYFMSKAACELCNLSYYVYNTIRMLLIFALLSSKVF